MTTTKDVENALDSLGKTAMSIKEQRDSLLVAAKAAYEAIDGVYDVDQPEPGQYREYPFSGAGEVMRKLRLAIHKAEWA